MGTDNRKSFSGITENALLASGWRKGRVVDVTRFKQDLLNGGYPWFESVETFLREFGGLTVRFLRKDSSPDFFHFDVSKAIQDIDSRWITETYASRIGSLMLCPIGQAFGTHMTLVMSEGGEIYGGYDENLYLIGSDWREAIDGICMNKELVEFPSQRSSNKES